MIVNTNILSPIMIYKIFTDIKITLLSVYIKALLSNKLNSRFNLWIHKPSSIYFVKAIYSDSMVERSMSNCKINFHKMQQLSRGTKSWNWINWPGPNRLKSVYTLKLVRYRLVQLKTSIIGPDTILGPKNRPEIETVYITCTS